MSVSYGLRGVASYGTVNLSANVEAGLVAWLNYGLESAGATTTVAFADETVYGYSPARLYPHSDPNYTAYSVYRSNRSNWISVSGVRVDGVPYTGHTIDYDGGRILFASGMGPTTIVEGTYTYRNVFVDGLNSNAGLRRIQDQAERGIGIEQYGSGDYDPVPSTRIQLPAIAVEPVDRRDLFPMQLGGGHRLENPVLFHVFAESNADVQRLTDILSFQTDKPIYLLDTQKIAESGAYGLDYPTLAVDYRWKLATLLKTSVQDVRMIVPGLHTATVRTTVELFMPEI